MAQRGIFYAFPHRGGRIACALRQDQKPKFKDGEYSDENQEFAGSPGTMQDFRNPENGCYGNDYKPPLPGKWHINRYSISTNHLLHENYEMGHHRAGNDCSSFCQ